MQRNTIENSLIPSSSRSAAGKTLYRRIFAAVLSCLLTISSGALYADALDDAKRAGQVGEQADGYLGAVAANAPAGVQALVADINKKRRSHYEKIAGRNGTTVQVVEQLAGKKAIEKTPPGGYVQTPGGWKRK